MGLDDLATDVKTGDPAGGHRSLESLEDAGLIFGRDSGPVITQPASLDPHPPSLTLRWACGNQTLIAKVRTGVPTAPMSRDPPKP